MRKPTEPLNVPSSQEKTERTPECTPLSEKTLNLPRLKKKQIEKPLNVPLSHEKGNKTPKCTPATRGSIQRNRLNVTPSQVKVDKPLIYTLFSRGSRQNHQMYPRLRRKQKKPLNVPRLMKKLT